MPVGEWALSRPGLFVVEANLPDAREYTVEIQAGPAWTAPSDPRVLTINLSMLRLVSGKNTS
jgi:hypothetical protein